MKTAICMATCIRNEKRLNDLKRTLNSLIINIGSPAVVVIVDDVSLLIDQVESVIQTFKDTMKNVHSSIDVIFERNQVNLKPSATFNKAMDIALAQSVPPDVLIHIEDDIVVNHREWNLVFAKCFQDHPEIGQVLPRGSGRSEWIPRPGYKEFPWGIGGLWAIRREVYEKVGGWDVTLIHQHEPDYNIRVRMAGWRLGEIDDFTIDHLGEGDDMSTFDKQAGMHIGVYNFLKKWNRRFIGAAAYRDIWLMSFEDFPINVNFRRQLAAWNVSQLPAREDLLQKIEKGEVACSPEEKTKLIERIEATKKCHMNQTPEPFIFPDHWGKYELVKLIRSPHREREAELIKKMGEHFVFQDVDYLPTHIKSLADRMGKQMTDEEVAAYIKDKEHEYRWMYVGETI